MSIAPTLSPGGTIASMRSSTSSERATSTPARVSSSCSIVRGPAIAEVAHAGSGGAEIVILPGRTIPASEGASGERAVDQCAHAVALCHGEDLALDLAVEE